MNEFMENKISEAELNEVSGGVGAAEVKVKPITEPERKATQADYDSF